MQMTGTFLMIWILSMLGLGVFTSDNVLASAPASVNVPFEQLKQLAGTWQAKNPGGKVTTETVQVVSAGSAVMVNMEEGRGENMITMFNPDGDSVIATHYCAAKNQPRFVLVPSNESNVLAFAFKGVSNLPSPDAGHMHGLIIRFKDADHHSEAWTWRENGKEKVETMEFTRTK